MLTVAARAPAFSLPGVLRGRVETYSLARSAGRWRVVFFYPRDFTFICPTEVVGFHKRSAEFDAFGALVLGISVDPVETHARWAESLGGLSIPLLADPGGAVARAYGVFHEEEGVALRATFIVDPEGVVQHAAVTHRNVGRGVGETLRVLAALHTGRLCPADWKPGDETLEATEGY